jgi:glycosyltransferase involved in cell wall biosynthesis
LRGKGDDLDRFIFTGRVLPEQLAAIFRLSDLHIYLTAPFVLSWSLLDAMASGCVVLASDVPPVREVIEPGRNGLVEPLFDIERLTETALRVLDDPAAFAPLGRAARETVEQNYRVEVCIPPLADYFERIASGKARR